MGAAARTFRGASFEQACQIARLELSAERRAVVGPALEGVYALIDTLDAVELGESAPATAFDARWE
jgi:hypothetical protein